MIGLEPARRVPAVPFALPVSARGRQPILGSPHFVALVLGMSLVPFCIVGLLYPHILDMFDRREVLQYRLAFGFDAGTVPTDAVYPDFAITSVTAGGPADRAGLRPGDVIRSHGSGPGSSLLRAVKEASAGHRACLEVRNSAAAPRSRASYRSICLGPGR